MKCPDGCTCHRHRKCPPGCDCRRHAGVVCAEGCTCDRHTMRKCEPGCVCGKHSDNLTYIGKHQRVYRTRGRAADQSCAQCGEPAKEWAQIHGTDGTDPHAHYQPMCFGCHAKYDGKIERLRQANLGQKFTDERRARFSQAKRAWNASLTPEQRSENVRKAWQTRRNKKVGD